jgi:hypothetical protein
MMTHEGMEVKIYDMLNSTLVGGEWSASCTAALLPTWERVPVPPG